VRRKKRRGHKTPDLGDVSDIGSRDGGERTLKLWRDNRLAEMWLIQANLLFIEEISKSPRHSLLVVAGVVFTRSWIADNGFVIVTGCFR